MSSSFARRFRWLALALIAISGALLSLGSIPVPDSQTATLPDGFDSTRVAAEREAASDHQGGATATALVLFTGDIGSNRAALAAKAKDLGGPFIPNDDGTAALVPLEVADGTASDTEGAVKDLRDRARADLPADIDSSVTGPAAIRADLAGVFSGANFKLLAVTAAIVAILLVFTYRSPFLWLIPLAVIGLADPSSLVPTHASWTHWECSGTNLQVEFCPFWFSVQAQTMRSC